MGNEAMARGARVNFDTSNQRYVVGAGGDVQERKEMLNQALHSLRAKWRTQYEGDWYYIVCDMLPSAVRHGSMASQALNARLNSGFRGWENDSGQHPHLAGAAGGRRRPVKAHRPGSGGEK